MLLWLWESEKKWKFAYWHHTSRQIFLSTLFLIGSNSFSLTVIPQFVIAWNVFCYYSEYFNFWFPCHKSGSRLLRMTDRNTGEATGVGSLCASFSVIPEWMSCGAWWVWHCFRCLPDHQRQPICLESNHLRRQTANYCPIIGSLCPDSRPDGMAKWVKRPSSFWGGRGIQTHGFESWSSQISDLLMDTCRFLARCSVLLGLGKDWLVQCQDNVTEWVYQVMILAAWSVNVAAL